MNRAGKWKKWLIRLILAASLVCGFVLLCDLWVRISARSSVFSDLEQLPGKDVALVLGTSKNVRGGQTNLFFTYRMDAAARLYQACKVEHFILSGDNRTRYYDEPNDMRAALIARDVPATAITLDYAGFRTFDSVVRCKEIFGQESVIIVSQEFHNLRAVFIARNKGIDAVAYNARSLSRSYSPKTWLREYLARTRAVLDVYVLGTKPYFLGKKEEIVI